MSREKSTDRLGFTGSEQMIDSLSDKKSTEGLAKLGLDQGYRWVRLSPVSNWQVVQIIFAVGDHTDREKTMRVFFMGQSSRLRATDFVREYPIAEWGDRVAVRLIFNGRIEPE